MTVNNSLKVNGRIDCQTLNIASDQRVKHKKKALDAKTSLEQVRALNPVQFEYKNRATPVHGFFGTRGSTGLAVLCDEPEELH